MATQPEAQSAQSILASPGQIPQWRNQPCQQGWGLEMVGLGQSDFIRHNRISGNQMTPFEKRLRNASEKSGLPIKTIRRASTHEAIWTRYALWQAMTLDGMSQEAIARLFDRDRTTVRHGALLAQTKAETDEAFNTFIGALRPARLD